MEEKSGSLQPGNWTFEDFCETFRLQLDSQQERAVRHTKGPCLVLAVPGSGKTTVILARLGYLSCCRSVPLDRILTVTFSVDAARSLERRFEEKFSQAGFPEKPVFSTIHSLALWIIRAYCDRKGSVPFDVMPQSEAVLRSIIRANCEIEYSDVLAEDVLSDLYRYRLGDIRRDELQERHPGVRIPDILRSYAGYKRKNRRMDYEDLLIYALRILKQCPEVLAEFQDQYDYFCVDEAQDNSSIQNEILERLSEKSGNLFLVGDEDQCIYRFRGADPDHLLAFSGRDEVTLLKLETNYRSHRRILDLAQTVIRQNRHRHPKSMKGCHREEGRVRLHMSDTRQDRDAYILSDVRRWETAAVLCRNNESLITTAHRLFREGVPFQAGSGLVSFFEREPVRKIFALFSACLEEEAEVPAAMRRYLKNSSVRGFLRQSTPREALTTLLNPLGYRRYLLGRWGSVRQRERILMKLDLLDTLANDYQDLHTFCRGMTELKQRLCTASDIGAVSLLTCHGAKGLEFDKVYLIDLLDKVFPSCYYITDGSTAEYEEEVRLLYVAITRARKELEVLSVRQSRWGRSEPSIFEKEIEAFHG